MFCPKCGNENSENNVFCSKCGNTLISEKKTNERETETHLDNIKEAEKKIASAHVLNIIAFALLVVCVVLTIYIVGNNTISSTTSSNQTTTTTTTSVSFEDQSRYVYIAAVGSAVLFFAGLGIYKTNEIATKKKLALFYMLASIPLCAFSIFASFANSLSTCGLSFLLLASCIMQIVVGAKFYMATKLYEN